jgi:hypothetical protein
MQVADHCAQRGIDDKIEDETSAGISREQKRAIGRGRLGVT